MDDRDMLGQSLTALLRHHCGPEVVAASEGHWSPALWRTLAEAGMTAVGLPQSLGGPGGELADAAAVVRTAARFAAPVPLAEGLLLAGPLQAAAGMAAGPGPVAVAFSHDADGPAVSRAGTGWTLVGRVSRVPWARVCPRVLVVARNGRHDWVLATVSVGRCRITPGHNLAGEPRDDVDFAEVALGHADVAPLPGAAARDLPLNAALSRVVLTAGALERTLELACAHAAQREQFGRPIGRFQAVRQLIAQLAEEVGAAVAAAQGAVAAARADNAAFVIAAARVRSARAATSGAEMAHQIHGALGIAREHELQHFTRRLWSWRDEYGTEGSWERRLGRAVLAAGPDALWPLVVGT
jgi:acyl-CoA dehydrogenase